MGSNWCKSGREFLGPALHPCNEDPPAHSHVCFRRVLPAMIVPRLQPAKSITKSLQLHTNQRVACPIRAASSQDWGGILTPIPARKDWRGILTPVPNTEKSGLKICTHTAVVGATEAVHAIKTGEVLELSIQELVDCNYNLGTGWDPMNCLEYTKMYGLHFALDYPYLEHANKCKAYELFGKKKIFISDYNVLRFPQTNTIIELLSKQPVIALVNSSILENYHSGIILNGSNKMKKGNHCILVVGYETESNPWYFICRNNLGIEWGEKGYFRIECKYFHQIRNQMIFYPVIDERAIQKEKEAKLRGAECLPGQENFKMNMCFNNYFKEKKLWVLPPKNK